jgi:hypothetical protein
MRRHWRLLQMGEVASVVFYHWFSDIDIMFSECFLATEVAKSTTKSILKNLLWLLPVTTEAIEMEQYIGFVRSVCGWRSPIYEWYIERGWVVNALFQLQHLEIITSELFSLRFEYFFDFTQNAQFIMVIVVQESGARITDFCPSSILEQDNKSYRYY